MLEYIELQPNAKSAFDADKEWREQACRSLRCRCSRPKFDVHGPIDVVVANARRDMLVDFIFGFSGFEIVAAALVEKLGSENVSSLFHVGTVSLAGNKPFTRYVTLRSKGPPVYIRGDETSLRRICPECGRLVLGAYGDAYLCNIQQPDIMLQSTFGQLLLRSDFYLSALKGYPLQKVAKRRLEVREEPMDGLPASIEEATRLVAQQQAANADSTD